MEPETTPMVTRLASTSRRVVLPAPETPFALLVVKGRYTCCVTYHESGKSAGLDPTIDIVQNAARFVLDLDVVAYILPVEYRSLLIHTSQPIRAGIFNPSHLLGSAILIGFDIDHGLCRLLVFLHRGPRKDQDFTLRSLRHDELQGDKVKSQE